MKPGHFAATLIQRGKTRLRDSGMGASMSNAAIRSSYGPSDPSLPAAASGRFGATLAASR
jgi:hypothetical protein